MILEETFQQKLEREIGKKLKLKINENKSTMLSVKWEPGCTRVSLHKFFLQAPKNVMDGLACYIRREDKRMAPEVTTFIEENTKKLDYSKDIDKRKLVVQGDVYNLDEMMDAINKRYFNNKLKLHITWFGNADKKNKSKVTFGLYQEPLKLIKINRVLDNAKYPQYLLSYVIYHEMLHHVCPPYVNGNGKNMIHNQEFKLREAEYHDFDRAQRWIKKNINHFFSRIY
jgi:hypothetical protein